MKICLILSAVVVLAVLGGCNGEPDNGPPPLVKTQETINAQIEKIKNDPNMTPQAKEAAARGIQAGFDAAKREAAKAKQDSPNRPR